jgi:hypothetical protein
MLATAQLFVSLQQFIAICCLDHVSGSPLHIVPTAMALLCIAVTGQIQVRFLVSHFLSSLICDTLQCLARPYRCLVVLLLLLTLTAGG